MGRKRTVSWGFFWCVRSKNRHGQTMLLSHDGTGWVVRSGTDVDDMIKVWKDKDEADRWLIQRKLMYSKPEFDNAEVVELELMVHG